MLRPHAETQTVFFLHSSFAPSGIDDLATVKSNRRDLISGCLLNDKQDDIFKRPGVTVVKPDAIFGVQVIEPYWLDYVSMEKQYVTPPMQKSVVVAVQRITQHPLYPKFVKKTSKIMAHDENNECNTGDQVRISPSRPLSQRKAWIVTDIIKKEHIFQVPPPKPAEACSKPAQQSQAATKKLS